MTPEAYLLAGLAQLEAASVGAFRRLERELAAHSAPRRLSERAARAAVDEIRHARVMRRLAESRGAAVGPVARSPRSVRALEAIAVENAVEGCVRETYGAAVAMIQAATARDADVRSAMRRVAVDETRHAELAWAVARWLDTRLDARGRRRVRRAMREAADALVAEASQQPATQGAAKLGLLPGSRAADLARHIRATLWAS